PPLSTLFPYPTLFRSLAGEARYQRRRMISFVAQPLYSDLVFSDMGSVAAEVADPRPVQNEAARIYLVMTSRVVKQPHGLVVESRSEEHTSELQSRGHL